MNEPTDRAVLPPTSAHFSSTIAEAPEVAAEMAALMPEPPPPMTRTSAV